MREGLYLLVERQPLFGKESRADIDNIRVIVGAPVLCDLLQRNLNATGRSVGPMRSHGLHHISHRQDAGLQRDLFPPKSLGIARAVQPLVMLQHDLSDGLGKFYPFQYLVARLGMGLDNTELGIAYPTGLIEDLSRHGDLADIMDQPGHAESLKLLLR